MAESPGLFLDSRAGMLLTGLDKNKLITKKLGCQYFVKRRQNRENIPTVNPEFMLTIYFLMIYVLFEKYGYSLLMLKFE